jgi:hypothetical protein
VRRCGCCTTGWAFCSPRPTSSLPRARRTCRPRRWLRGCGRGHEHAAGRRAGTGPPGPRPARGSHHRPRAEIELTGRQAQQRIAAAQTERDTAVQAAETARGAALTEAQERGQEAQQAAQRAAVAKARAEAATAEATRIRQDAARELEHLRASAAAELDRLRADTARERVFGLEVVLTYHTSNQAFIGPSEVRAARMAALTAWPRSHEPLAYFKSLITTPLLTL